MVLVASLTLLTRKFKFSATIILSSALAGIFFILPWIFTLLSNLHLMSGGIGSEPTESLSIELFSLSSLFSGKESAYGGKPFQYSTLVFLCLAAGVGSLFLFRSEERHLSRKVSIAATASGGITLFLIYTGTLSVLPPEILNFRTSLRYSIPFLLGIAPAILMLSYLLIRDKYKNSFGILLSMLSILAVIQFAPQTNARIRQALNCGSTLAFSELACDPSYRDYNDTVFLSDGSDVARWQNFIPEGEALIAWINTPFFLDFARNPVFELDISGLDNPWVHLPDASYVIVEYNAPATHSLQQLEIEAASAPLYERRIAKKTIRFLSFLNKVDKELVYRDETVIIFKLSDFPEATSPFNR